MRSRIVHAVSAYATFLCISGVYGLATGEEIDLLPLALWSGVGIASYIALSQLFGFDPHRTRLAHSKADWMHYIDRWELRLGQATLSLLGCMIVAAKMLDDAHFVLAVVSGTLSAWTYFAWRLYSGGYDSSPNCVR